jgi:LmbE family N-acetylglucosaminyl deacetylase
MTKKMLVIAAHPDDEVLGAGGVIANRTRQGWEVCVVWMTSGVAGRYGSPLQDSPDVLGQQKKLSAESRQALKALGVQRHFNLNFPDNRLDIVSKMDMTQALSKIVQTFKPKVVLTHHHGDYNWDHTLTFAAALMACRPNPGDFYPEEIYAFEVLSSTERSYQTAQAVFTPNYFEDISRTIGQKKRALAAYCSEIRPYPHPRSQKGVEILAQKRGLEVGLRYAEAFQLIRKIQS